MAKQNLLLPRRVLLPSRMQVQSERDRLIRRERRLKRVLHAVGLGIGAVLLITLCLLRFSALRMV